MQLIILGRDGVINKASQQGINTPDDWDPVPGSLEAIARLNHAGYKVAVATEQPGLRTGQLDLDALNSIHARFHHLLSRVGGHVDAIFVCPHGPDDADNCEDSKSGLYQRIIERFSMPARVVPVVSNDLNDLHAAKQIGSKPFLVGKAEGEANPQYPAFKDLNHAVEHLLTKTP